MDLLSHIVITRKLVGRDVKVVLAGLVADVPFYLLYPVWALRRHKLSDMIKNNQWPEAPKWMQTLHHVFHSLPLVLGISAINRIATGLWPYWSMAWSVHILVDIPTHSRQAWAPQFLWPFSKVTVNGFSWPMLLFALIRHLYPK